MWQKIISIIENHDSFVITSHKSLDCDAIGSELALAKHLRALGKKVTVINNDPVPPTFRFLDPLPDNMIECYTQARHSTIINKVQTIFVVDASGGWERMGRLGKILKQAQALKVCIDHHPDATDFVDVAVIDTDAAATAELIYSLLVTMNGHLSQSIAQALYSGILTDTGSFRFPKTSPQTHLITAELLAAGANPSYIYKQIYEQYSLEWVRLKGYLINSIQTEARGQIAYYSLKQSELKDHGIKASELNGFASLGQEISGVRATIFCLETAKNRIKISLRSDGTVPINQVAMAYQGGGHPSAAGAVITGQLDEVMNEVIEKVKALL